MPDWTVAPAYGPEVPFERIAINEGALCPCLSPHLVNVLFSPATTCNWNRVQVPVRDPIENAFNPRSSLADNRMPRLSRADGHQEGHHRWARYEDRHRRLHLRDLPN